MERQSTTPESTQRWAQRERGQALFLVLVAAMLVMLIGTAIVQVAQLNQQRAKSNRTDEQLLNAARVGFAQAKYGLWNQYLKSTVGSKASGDPGNLTNARAYLDGFSTLGPWPATANLPAGATIQVFPDLVLSKGSIGGMSATGQSMWVRVTAERQDSAAGTSTFVKLRSVATVWDPATATRAARQTAGLPADQRVVETIVRYGGAEFDGFRFALLANAVNCTFCHADIDNASRVHNHDPTQAGTFDRVRVATLETLEMRTGANSYVAGTLYVQGFMVNSQGTEITTSHAAFTNSNGLKAAQVDSNGKIVEDATVNGSGNFANGPEARLTKENFTQGATNGAGEPVNQYDNIYQNYPADPTKQVDGPLPDKFPPVVSDTNDNRKIDDSEWTAHVSSFGSATDPAVITGGTARLLFDNTANEKYSGNNLPTSGSDTIPPVTTGKSAILVGTDTNPIEINGKVAFDGDVVISGTIKGSGQILARGNIYIQGDLKYADGTDASGNRTFGVADDGTKNVVAYAAGGMIIHGQYLMGDRNNWKKQDGEGLNGTKTSYGGWALQETAWWNRTELTKAMPFFDAAKNRPTLDPGVGGSLANPTNAANPAYIPGYKPRFYTFAEHDHPGDKGKIWIYGYGSDYNAWDGGITNWDNTRGYWQGDGNANVYGESQKLEDLMNTMDTRGDGTLNGLKNNMANGSSSAYDTLAMDPKDGWIDQDVFRDIQINSDADRLANRGRTAFQLDGLFYTSNAMIFAARGQNRDSGNSRIEFNGSVVAADTGILSGGGLKLNYDVRTRAYLNIEDNSEVELYTVIEREGIE